jgi:broad specificity phosphatase PhoE
MKITFVYVRHGETLFNRRGRVQGVCDSPLSLTGIEQAEFAAAALKNVYFDKAFLSPSGRCQETASYILADRDLEPVIEDGLHEMDFGRMEGSRFTSHPDELRNCFATADFGSCGGESYQDVEKRIDHTFRKIREACQDGDRVLLVSHGMLETFVLHHLMGVDFRAYDTARRKEGKNGIPNGGIMVFKYEDGKYSNISMPVEPEIYHPFTTKKTVHFYFVRHSETLFNVYSRMQGRCDSPLTENGYHQAEVTADALKNTHFDLAFSSPLERAWRTAKILTERHEGLKLQKCDGLMEVSYGDFEAVVITPYQKEIHERHVSKGWQDVGGESLDDVSLRIHDTLKQIIEQAKDGDTVLLVSHGNWYVNVIRSLFGINRDELFDNARKMGRQARPNGGIARFDYVNGQYELVDLMKSPEEYWNEQRKTWNEQ